MRSPPALRSLGQAFHLDSGLCQAVGGSVHRVTTSNGVVLIRDFDGTIATLITRARSALPQAAP
jgi:hypothetical protein